MSATATKSERAASGKTQPTPSLRSRVGANASNYFLAEITGVVIPFLGAYFQRREWSKSSIGNAATFAVDPPGSYTAVPRTRPAVGATKFC